MDRDAMTMLLRCHWLSTSGGVHHLNPSDFQQNQAPKCPTLFIIPPMRLSLPSSQPLLRSLGRGSNLVNVQTTGVGGQNATCEAVEVDAFGTAAGSVEIQSTEMGFRCIAACVR